MGLKLSLKITSQFFRIIFTLIFSITSFPVQGFSQSIPISNSCSFASIRGKNFPVPPFRNFAFSPVKPFLSQSFTRDKLGRITQKTETTSGVTNTYAYTYDLTGRLTDVSKNTVNVSHYEFDSNGNRISAVLAPVVAPFMGPVSGSATYDNQDRLLTYGDFSYTYTANGELLTKTDTTNSETTSYVYDALGNLLSVVLPNGTLIEYVIDGQNRRVGKKINGVLVQGWLYQNSLKPVAELDGSGNVVSRFIYGSWPFTPDYMVKGGVTYRIITDHLGSPRLIVNTSNGTIAQRLDFDEFGNVFQDTAPAFQSFGFAGGHFDPDTGLTRFGARDYDPQTGRWTCKDPTDFGGGDTNLFRYCFNDPVNYFDIEGEFAILLVIGILILSTTYANAPPPSGPEYGGMAQGNLALAAPFLLPLSRCPIKGGGAPPVDPNKLRHIFDQSKHNLENLVQKFGSKEKAFEALQKAAQNAVNKQGISGQFSTSVNVAGETIVVRGTTVDGIAKLGTAYKP